MTQTPEQLKKATTIATISSVAFLFAYGIISPFLTPYLISKGFTKAEISLVFSIAPLFLIFTSAVLGRIADVVGRKKVLVLSIIAIIGSLATFLWLPNRSFAVLITASIILTVAYQAYAAASLERAQDGFNNKSRGLATGVFESLRSVGMLSGILLGTVIVGVLPISAAIKASLICFVALLGFGMSAINKNHNKLTRDDFNPIADMKEFLSIRELRGMAILGMTTNFATGASTIFVPLLLTQEIHADIRYVGLFAAVLSLSHVAQFAFGKACDITGDNKMIVRAVISLGLTMSLFFFAHNPIVVLLMGLGIGLSAAAWNTSAWCYMSRIGEKTGKEGLVVGTYMSFAYAGVGLGYLATSVLSTSMGTRSVFLLYSGVILIGIWFASKSFNKLSHL